MWFLIKSFCGLLFFGACAYGIFFVDVGDRSIAAHAEEVWETPVIQQKVRLVKSSFENVLKKRLSEAQQKEKTGRKISSKLIENFDKADREELRKLLAQNDSDE